MEFQAGLSHPVPPDTSACSANCSLASASDIDGDSLNGVSLRDEVVTSDDSAFASSSSSLGLDEAAGPDLQKSPMQLLLHVPMILAGLQAS